MLVVHGLNGKGGCTCPKAAACASAGKHPRTLHGVKDATTDADVIRGWWNQWPNSNIGIATGERSGLLVLDVDPRHRGDEALESLLAEHGDLPDTVEVLTGGGGRHVFLRHQSGIACKQLAPGIDVRGDGGYVVAPPSAHASGRQYEWEASSHPDAVSVSDPPTWLIEVLAERGRPAASNGSRSGVILEGARNATLTSMAGAMRRPGMTTAEIEAALTVANRARCVPPLADEEVRRIAASVARYPSEPDEDRANVESSPRVYTITDARLRSTESLEYLPVLGQDGYVVRGWTHLLAGWWRLGKSELTAAVILPWLRVGVIVVWVTEEPDSVWADRADVFEEIYPPVPWERLTLIDALSAQPAALLDCVAGIEADVVVLDTIKECCGIASMNDDEAVERGLSPWLRRLRGRRTLVALAQHRKAAGDDGARILGTVNLPSKFDVTLELDTVDGHERQRRLKVRRRRAATGPLVYEMDEFDRLVVIPDPRSRGRLETEAAALAIVDTATEPLTTMEVRQRMSQAPDRDTVLRALTALAEAGRVLRDPPITEAAKRRKIRWRSAASTQMHLPQNSLLLVGEFSAEDGPAEDSPSDTGPIGAFTSSPDSPCERCGAPGWHPPCRPAPPWAVWGAP